MNKGEDDKLANAIIALHQEIKGLRGDMDKQLAKVNLSLGELRLSYMKMSDEVSGLRSDFNKYAKSNDALVRGHETRIARLEEKTPGNAYLASEPAVKYKRKKRK